MFDIDPEEQEALHDQKLQDWYLQSCEERRDPAHRFLSDLGAINPTRLTPSRIQPESPPQPTQVARSTSLPNIHIPGPTTTELLEASLAQGPPSRTRRALVTLGIGCIRMMGMKDRVIRKVAFFPPKPPGYTMKILQEPSTWFETMMNSEEEATKNCNVLRRRALPIVVKQCQCSLITKVPRHGTHMPHNEHEIRDASAILKGLAGCHLTIASFKIIPVGLRDIETAAILLWKPMTSPMSKRPITRKITQDLEDPRLDVDDAKCIRRDLAMRPLFIFSHGNSTDIGRSFLTTVQLASRLHVNILAYDYASFGWSKGKLSEKNVHGNFNSAYILARYVLQVPPSNIFIYGQSIGSSPTCRAAGNPIRYPVAGVILHSPLASGRKLLSGANNGALKEKLDVFDNIRLIANCPWPILLIHGTDDKEIPCWHTCLLEKVCKDYDCAGERAKKIFEQFVAPKLASKLQSEDLPTKTLWSSKVTCWLVAGAGHNDIEIRYKPEYFSVLRRFVTMNAETYKTLDYSST